MDYETASFIATIIACAISLIALAVTFVSATAAKESASAAKDTLRHTRISEITTLAQSIVSDEMRIKLLASNLKMTMQFVATASRAVGSTRHLIENTELDKECSKASSLAEQWQSLLNDSESLLVIDENEINRTTIELRKCSAQIQVIREKIEQQLSQYQQLQHSYREQFMQSRTK